MKIEIGKYYSDRIDRVWGPMKKSNFKETPFIGRGKIKGHVIHSTFTRKGVWFPDVPTLRDLVKEVPKP